MKNTMMKTYAFISGAILMLVGFYIAITPLSYLEKMNSQNLVSSVNMLSDLRGMGGMILVLGVFVFLSAFMNSWLHSAIKIAVTIFISFVVFRSVGFVLDGLPTEEIIAAYAIELILAILGLVMIKTNTVKNFK